MVKFVFLPLVFSFLLLPLPQRLSPMGYCRRISANVTFRCCVFATWGPIKVDFVLPVSVF